MSLKNIMRKTIASLGAISIVFGNCSLCGIGLVRVIAENEITPAIKAEMINEKYVQYQYEEVIEENQEQTEQEGKEIKGVAIQSKLSVYPEYNQDTYLPTESVVISLNLPKINGFLPEKATVVEASTKATTGEDINTNINQNYDSNSGILIMSYNNTPDENGNIYSIYNENTKDEFEIIYIYPAEAYVGNEEEIKIESSVNVKMLFRTENGIAATENTKSFELIEKDNKGDVTTFGITGLESDVYKGYMYSNVENGTSYDTEFNSVSTFAVLNSVITDEIVMELKEAEIVLDDKEESKVSTNGNVVYKTTKLRKAEFDKILGQDGVLEIYDGETLVSTVKYMELSENEQIVKKLVVRYSDEDIRIISDEETDIVIEHKEDVTSLKIKISKPITEGFIHFENKNVIKATGDYGVEIKDIKYLSVEGSVNDYSRNVKIRLLEPETKISIQSSNTNFSTLQTNKTTLTIKLDDTNSSTKLFNNPVITVKLPNGLIKGTISSPNIINGNGLELKGQPKVGDDKQSIIIELTGKQTEYDLSNVSGGTSIVMDIENIDYEDTLPSFADKIEVTCSQREEVVQASCDVNIVSKEGLLVLSKISGFDNENTTLTSIDNELKTVNLDIDDVSKQVVQTIDLVNNFDNEITNVELIGRLGYIGENLSSNFDVKLVEEIKVNSGKVYYSTNPNASYNDDTWTEEFTADAKAYKIEINDDNKLASKDKFEIKLTLNVPANLYYNQESYIKTDVNYQYNGNNMSENSLIGFVTEKNNLANYAATIVGEENPVTIIFTPSITQNYVHSRQRVTYNIKVINNGTQDLKNLVLEDIIPDNAIYTYVKEIQDGSTEDKEIIQDTETKNVEWIIEELRAGESTEFEIMLTMADVVEEQEIVNTVILKHNEESIKREKKLTLKPAMIETTLTTDSEYIINPTYKAGNELKYYIKVKNIHDKKLKDVKVNFEIPSTLTYIEGGLTEKDEFRGYLIEEAGNINNNMFEYTIKSLAKNKEEVICVKVKVNQLLEGYEADITTIGKVTVNSNNDQLNEIYESNIKTIKTKQTNYRINLASNIPEGTVLKRGNEIIYTIEVESIGGASGGIIIRDNIPEQLKVKKIEEYKNNELKQNLLEAKNNIEWLSSLGQGEKIILKITAEVDLVEVAKVENIEISNIATVLFESNQKSSNEIKTFIQPELRVVEEDGYNPEDVLQDSEDNQEDENPSDDEPTGDKEENNEGQQTKTYKISGVAWLDLDKNGERTDKETLLQNIKVSLINMTTGDFAKDPNGNSIIAVTDSQGKYEFNNLPSGSYEVMFEYDTEKYTVTTYKKEGIDEKENSDAILSTVKIYDTNKVVALTDKLELKENVENLDLGLIENAKFDLSLDKQITEITVIDKQGTETYEYKNGHTAKVDLVAKYMNGANVIVNYKFTVKNDGEVTGYVDSLMDSLPSGLEFSSELNKNWYKDTDGNLYTTSLSGKAIKPGESIEVDLVLTKTMTEENAGTFVNNAKLEKISNLENIKEKEDAVENNESSAILLISIKTGSVILYMGVTMICLAIIGIGAYFIKKKVLMRII